MQPKARESQHIHFFHFSSVSSKLTPTISGPFPDLILIRQQQSYLRPELIKY